MVKSIVWLGDSLDRLRSFPDRAKEHLGADLKRLQLGNQPFDSRPMKSIAAGVFELRDRDKCTCYRIIYYMRLCDRIVVLNVFTKNSAKTPLKELLLASRRLKLLIHEEKI